MIQLLKASGPADLIDWNDKHFLARDVFFRPGDAGLPFRRDRKRTRAARLWPQVASPTKYPATTTAGVRLGGER